ncbi:MAG TPA: hypothetical protein VGB30_14350 [bacterium]
MTGFSILLEKLQKLPYRQLGQKVADITGDHVQTAYTRLRRTRGIVWDNLTETQAIELAQFLTSEGFSSVVVPDEDIVTFGKPIHSKNTDVSNAGIELEDMYGAKQLFPPEWVSYAHAGWVTQTVDEFRKPGGKYATWEFGPQGSALLNTPSFIKDNAGQSLGWSLFIFGPGEKPNFIQIIGSKFNYDYQGDQYDQWEFKFAKLMSDLKNILAEEAVDSTLVDSMQQGEIPDDASYDDFDDMLENASWRMTLRNIKMEQ